MAERLAAHVWVMRALYLALCSIVVMFHLLPLGQRAAVTFAPDVILCLTLAWVVRRPDYAPLMLIAVVALLSDLLLMRIPGLWAALSVLLAQSIRNQRRFMRSTGFGVEWFRVSIGIAAAFFAERIAMMVLFVEPHPFATTLAQYAATVLVYPVVVAVSVTVFRVRKPVFIDATIGRRPT